ncbi:hypothetical protein Avbf_09690, partial [Armadillidium vulgare]
MPSDLCPINIEGKSPDELLTNPPAGWTFECMTEELINQALSTRHHVENVVKCLNYETVQCGGRGYEALADELVQNVGSSGQCSTCSPRLVRIIQNGLQKLRRKYPDLYKEGLQYIG